MRYALRTLIGLRCRNHLMPGSNRSISKFYTCFTPPPAAAPTGGRIAQERLVADQVRKCQFLAQGAPYVPKGRSTANRNATVQFSCSIRVQEWSWHEWDRSRQ
jgi:hypothetical protein